MTTATAKTFGSGILPTYPHYQADHSASDEAWLLADDLRRLEAARLERQAGEALAVARHERGVCCY